MLIVVLALVVPPLLLLPMVLHMSYAQYFKDFYEASMWISPAIGMITILLMTSYLKQGQVSLRQVRPVIVLVGAVFDLLSPVYLYILLAVLAGH